MMRQKITLVEAFEREPRPIMFLAADVNDRRTLKILASSPGKDSYYFIEIADPDSQTLERELLPINTQVYVDA